MDPTLYKAWVNLGIALEKKERFTQAERAYRQALVHQPPEFPLAHYALAGLYEKVGLMDNAPIGMRPGREGRSRLGPRLGAQGLPPLLAGALL